MCNVLAVVNVPPLGWIAPFAVLLLAIAILPLIPHSHRWWERNGNKFLVAAALGAITLVYYAGRGFGVTVHDPLLAEFMHRSGYEINEHDGHHATGPGAASLLGALGNAMFEYVPFIILLFTLYCISGGIAIRGDLPAHPATNTLFLAVGGALASVIGTTGASMLLIRPLIQTNSERKHVTHTVVFFIFIVSNIGGCLLPIGDPPVFLGYLRGVPFLWTLSLWKEWAFSLVILLLVYYVWDTRAYWREAPRDIVRDQTRLKRLRLIGKINLLWLATAVLAVATLSPNKPFPRTDWTPPAFLREVVQVGLVALSFLTTPHGLRHSLRFNFAAITEVACLFIGVFLTMQVPVEILSARGAELSLREPWHFFWATGTLSSFLDNAPTYVVFFQAANALTTHAGDGILPLLDGNFIRHDLLAAVSLGAVFMGANTYIGNGPNFMVKAIAESSGVKMPSFFGFMVYSGVILIPLFAGLTFLFMR